jgi:8-oxo-dGTP diphosphatase
VEQSAEEHFMRVFGASPEAVLAGATPTSFPANEPTLPSQCENFDLNRTYDELDSWFIGRGFTPTAMEEKWFIYLAEGVLTFRRSWTGIVIYEVEAEWRGAQLRLSRARVNRDPSQYGETDTAFDHHLLLYIIDVVLLGKEAIFPTKPALEPDGSALRAWSIVGKASL